MEAQNQAALYERLNQIERVQAMQGQTLESLSGQLKGIATALEGLQAARQISWPAIVGGVTVLGIIVSGIWYILNQNVQLEMTPLMVKTETSLNDRADIRLDTARLAERVGALEIELRGFRESSFMEIVEIETQFKNVGQQLNSRHVEHLNAHCRMDERECVQNVYLPELGRIVTNGRKH